MPVAYLYLIEFQMRGLPHAHMLMILQLEDKLLEASDTDQCVCVC